MIISTRGRYALRIMTDLAENGGNNYVPMKEIAAREELSLKYLEQIVPVLVKNGLLEGVQGIAGGYRLKKKKKKYPIGEILRLTEGTLSPVECPEFSGEGCEHREKCRTLPVWMRLNDLIIGYLDSVTLADLLPANGTN